MPGDLQVPSAGGGVIVSDWKELSRRGSSRLSEQLPPPADLPQSTTAPPPASAPPRTSVKRNARGQSSARTKHQGEVRARRAKERAERAKKTAAAKEAKRQRRREQLLASRGGGGASSTRPGGSRPKRTRTSWRTTERNLDEVGDEATTDTDNGASGNAGGMVQRSVSWYRRGFERFDKDGDGRISFGDFALAMNTIGHATMSHRTLSMLFNRADSARVGFIDFPAFLALMGDADSRETRLLERRRVARKERRMRGVD